MCFANLRLGKENTAQKMKFCSHLLKKSLMEKFIFCERYVTIAFNNISSEENLLPKGCWI